MTHPDETPVRTLSAEGGQVWRVYVVNEADRWDAGVTIRRRNWLCMESGRDRRYMSPVPRGWTQLPDATLAQWIAVAKPDLRGS